MEGSTKTKLRGDVGLVPPRHRHALAGSAGVVAAATLILVAGSAGAAARGSALARHPMRHGKAPVVIDSAKRGPFGAILVTQNGYTLYYDKSDTATTIACTGGCAQIWPPLVLPRGVRTAKAGPGVSQSDLGDVRRPDGTLQVTFAGHPLYRYVGDGAAGETKGQGVGGFYVVKASAKTSSRAGW